MNVKEFLAKLSLASDDVIKAEIVRKTIYRAADFIAVGTKVVGVQNFNVLDIKWSFPSEISAEYPVAEGATSTNEPLVTWTDFYMSLQKAEVQLKITDEAKVRQLDQLQVQTQLKRAAEALAKVKDQNILDALSNGAGGSHAATTAWNQSGADPAGDIVTAIENILEAPGVTDADVRNIAVIVPVKAYAHLLKLQEINNIKTTLADWFKESYGIEFYPTKYYSNFAIVMVKGMDSAIHGVYNGNQIPLSERFRFSGYDMYVVRQYFATKVVPDSSSTSTSSRIYKITNVVS